MLAPASRAAVAEGLGLLVNLSGRSVKLCIDPRRGHRKAPVDSRADIGRIIEHTGWTPTIPFEQSIHDLWHEQIKARDRSRTEVAPPWSLTA